MTTLVKKLSVATIGVSLIGLGAIVTPPQNAEAAAVRPGLFTGSTLPRNDDGSTGVVPIGFDTNFFGVMRNSLFVNNNGNVTFDNPLGTFTPFNLNTTSVPIIAPFFADVDTRNLGSLEVTYGNDTVDGRQAFGVNYVDVGYFSNNVDRLNSFQLVLIDRSDIAPGDFDIEFNYDQIQWETGDASGGSGGLGGNSARAGFANGSTAPGTFFELPGSAINGAFLDGGPNALISGNLNSNEAGRYIFSVRGGNIVIPGTPEPATILALVTFGAAGLSTRLNRKQKD